jgi:hypothetical protein
MAADGPGAEPDLADLDPGRPKWTGLHARLPRADNDFGAAGCRAVHKDLQ